MVGRGDQLFPSHQDFPPQFPLELSHGCSDLSQVSKSLPLLCLPSIPNPLTQKRRADGLLQYLEQGGNVGGGRAKRQDLGGGEGTDQAAGGD